MINYFCEAGIFHIFLEQIIVFQIFLESWLQLKLAPPLPTCPFFSRSRRHLELCHRHPFFENLIPFFLAVAAASKYDVRCKTIAEGLVHTGKWMGEGEGFLSSNCWLFAI